MVFSDDCDHKKRAFTTNNLIWRGLGGLLVHIYHLGQVARRHSRAAQIWSPRMCLRLVQPRPMEGSPSSTGMSLIDRFRPGRQRFAKGCLEVETEVCSSLPRAFTSCALPTEDDSSGSSEYLAELPRILFYYLFYSERELAVIRSITRWLSCHPVDRTPHYCRIRNAASRRSIQGQAR